MLRRIFSYMKEYKKYAWLALICIGVDQAKAVIFFLIVGLVAVIQNRMTRSKEVQQ